jgi:hypothetical protein
MRSEPHVMITDLPTDVLSCIAEHLRKDVGQWDQSQDDIAALRSACRSLRHALDLIVTHAKFHRHMDVEELRSVTTRCSGDRRDDKLELQSCNVPLRLHTVYTCACVLHRMAACPFGQRPGYH